MYRCTIKYLLCALILAISWVNVFAFSSVSQTSPPSIDRIIPSEGLQDTELNLTISGKGFALKSVVYFIPDTGITLFSITFISTGELRINIRISKDAPIGSRDVMVINPDQLSVTFKGGFTIKATQPSPGSIKLTPEKSENFVDTIHKVVATVLDTTGKPLSGAKVLFEVTGVNPTNSSAITDHNGQAIFAYTGGRPGNDTITAMVALGGMLPAFLTATASKVWYVKPPVPGSIKLTPDKAENPVSTDHRVVATVLDTNSKPMSGVKVLFTVTGANPTSGTVITDGNGQAVFIYNGSKAGDDTITATVDTLTSVAFKKWYVKVEPKPAPPPAITAIKPLGGEQGQILELTIFGKDFVDGAKISFSPTAGISIVSVRFVATTELKVRITIAKNAPPGARDIIVTNPDKQTGTLKGGFTVKPATVKPVPLVPGSIELTPEKSENPVSTDHRVVATVLDTNSKPMSGVKVLFTVTGANPTSGTVITDGNGQAVFIYNGSKAGDDTITAVVDNLTSTAYKVWFVKEEKEEVKVSSLKIISGPYVLRLFPDSVIINWETDEDSDSKVYYGIKAGKFEYTQQDLVMMKKRSILLSKLNPGTIYQFYVESRDAEGNQVRSKIKNFQTEHLEDKEKPSLSLRLSYILSGVVKITADVKDNTGIKRVVFSAYLKENLLSYTDYSSPYEWELDTRNSDEGPHSFSAWAVDYAGNITEEMKVRHIRHTFSANLSPVKVRILTPANRSEVYGMVGISAEISHDLNYRISRVEFKVDETVIKSEVYDPPFTFNPILSPYFIINHRWDARESTLGRHVIAVRVQDEFGTWGTASSIISVVEPPAPSISVIREVRRINNYFEIKLIMHNDGELDIMDLTISDTNIGYQCIKEVFWRRGEGLYWLSIEATITKHHRRHWQNTMRVSLGVLGRGEMKTLKYYVVPILIDPTWGSISHRIGSDTTISFKSNSREYSYNPSLNWSSSDGLTNSFRAADYLIVTCPYKLGLSDEAGEVVELLSKMAVLAKEKMGVLGFVSSATGNEGLKNLIKNGGDWSQLLNSGWVGNGYFLIVGEDKIVPSFDISGFNIRTKQGTYDVVRMTDFPYADIFGNDGLPDIQVGRIIGRNVSNLINSFKTGLETDYTLKGVVTSDKEGSHSLEKFARMAEGITRDLREKEVEVDTIHVKDYLGSMDVFDRTLLRLATAMDIWVYIGHGSQQLWGYAIGLRDIESMSFNSNPSIISIACLTGRYNGETTYTLPRTFFDKGVAVYVGSTEVTFGSKGEEISRVFFRDYFSPDISISEALTRFKRDKSRTGDIKWRFICHAYNLYGDPKIRVRD